MERNQYCSFRIDNHVFAIDILVVQEIIRDLSFTRIPLAPPVIEGLINLRGQIITAINMRHRLGLPAKTDGKQSVHVVVRTKDGPVSLLVDSIRDMIELDEREFEATPESIDKQARELISGVYKTPEQLYLLLDSIKTTSIDLSSTVK